MDKLLLTLLRFLRNSRGNLSLAFAGAFVVIMVGAGAAYDVNNIQTAKHRLQDAVDTAALAGASVARVTGADKEKTARAVLTENVALISSVTLTEPATISIDNNYKEINVQANAVYQTAFMGAFGKSNVDISAFAKTGFAIESMSPFSVYLVLDVSGSMAQLTSDGDVKIDVLKTAVDDMFYTLYSTSENSFMLNNTIRSGYSSYSDILGSVRDIGSGYMQTVMDVNSLVAVGGTNSTPGFQYAYDQLLSDNITSNWSGYLIFMTDGDNNDPLFDTETLALCDQAKAVGIMIYTIAFEAPAKGENLLQTCANGNGKFYKSTSAKKLNKAFRDIGSSISQSVVRIKK